MTKIIMKKIKKNFNILHSLYFSDLALKLSFIFIHYKMMQFLTIQIVNKLIFEINSLIIKNEIFFLNRINKLFYK